MILRIARFRPFLWVAAFLLLACLVSLTWEQQTSYDDGGIGSAALLVIALFVVPGQAVGLSFNGSVAVGFALLLALDLAVWFATRRRRYASLRFT